ncbi:MAG: FG-GAP-like repeat-containing protein [Acidobacteriaceae bacterium]
MPKAESAQYQQFVKAFYVGLAAMQVGNDARADDSLHQATQLAPGEPAAWADWGLLALRQRNYDLAEQRLDRAGALEKNNGRIEYMLGILESDRGNSAAAIDSFRRAAALMPANPRVEYSLAQEIERLGGTDSEAQVEQILQQMLDQHPKNVAVMLELSRIAAKRGDAATLHATVDRIAALSANWPADAKQRLADLLAAANGPAQAAATRSIFLRNVLMQLPWFRLELGAIHAEPGEEAPPFASFLRLATPRLQPAAPDTAMTFAAEPLANAPAGKWDWIGAVPLDDTRGPMVVLANAKTVQLLGGGSYAFPGGKDGVAPGPESVLPMDFNNDFKTDLVLAGAGGVRFLRQDAGAAGAWSPHFTDVTAQTKLPAPIVNGVWTGAWAVDIEADGDLDIVLGAASGLPTVLRNNGDGTFTPIHPFAGVSGVRQFVWADLDGDGNPDAALIDGAGQLHVFRNDRAGNFREIALPAGVNEARAVAAADTQHRGGLHLVFLQPNGAVAQLARVKGAWASSELARVPNSESTMNRDVRLFAADLDNNGGVDLVLATVGPVKADLDLPGLAAGGPNASQGALIWLAGEDGQYTLMDHPAGPDRVFQAAELTQKGRLDLLGLDADGHPVKAVNHGTKNYHWQDVRTRAVQATGDQRINSFGVGGEVELRSGLLLQAQPITGPEEHYGLGTWTETDVARILWPNGTVNAEFQLGDDQEVLAQQRLKGSCPFLFAWNGHAMEFVKDTVPWGSAIGLRINALGPARIAATEEWYKIPRNDLAPRDGAYDLRITGELWETYYYDWLEMMTVDHPAGTEVFTDERFVVPPVKVAVTATDEPHAIARAVDDRGNEVTEILRALDGRYLDTFGRGQYQGITRDHYVEIDLGDGVPASGPLYLIARGWVHPSDSSINVALSQGHHEQPKPLSLEVEDGHGGWVTARANLGFPAGRNKICLIDLTGVFRAGAPPKVRLRTNLEIYWDQIQWARGLPDTPLQITRIALSLADLHYRGYSRIHQANASSPEIPDYNDVASTTQIWRDLEGYYTRYGDVRELLGKVDDRYVIMNAGDEMALRFPEPAAPPAGWVRDFVLAGDGWIKDGDYNSTDSATVQPLPYHAKTEYDAPPGPLGDEWVVRQHPQDWLTWQTRYVTPEPFRDALTEGVPLR